LLERKFDRERCVAFKSGREVRLESRTGNKSHRHVPKVRAAVSAQRVRRLLLDGEIVAFYGALTSFGRLQQRLGVCAPSADLVSAYPVVYCVFDLLELDGEDHTGQPLLERRARLERAIRPRDGLQLSEAFRGDSQRRFAEACRSRWEGLIAKRADAPYARGRSRDWLKLKCAWEQELVIGGYTDPRGSRIELGALLVGYYEDDRLRYAGRSAPATPPRRCASSARGSADWRRPNHRSSMPGRSRSEHTGPGPSSSHRSASPNGRAKGGCVSRASSGCATTSTRPMSFWSDRNPEALLDSFAIACFGYWDTSAAIAASANAVAMSTDAT
jgi:hypothetical protein